MKKRNLLLTIVICLLIIFSSQFVLAQTGDVNEDGEVNIFDMILLAEYIVGSTNEDISMEVADVNGDGVVDIHDMILIARYIVGEIDEFPVEEEKEFNFDNIEIKESYKSFDHHNPVITQRFGADPAGMVYEDRLYVYSTHDVIERDEQGNITDNTYDEINTLNRISSDDLVNWTDHGTIEVAGYSGKASWADRSWAPDPAYKSIDGQDEFFLSFSNNAAGVGILTADNPVGPFEDQIGGAIVDHGNTHDVPWVFDPALFVDDDGTGYMYFGGGVPEGQGEMPNTGRVVELDDDMLGLAGTPEVIEAPYFFEAAYMNKIGDTYYFSYSTNFEDRSDAEGEHTPPAGTIPYMTADDPMGPFEYQNVILENPASYFDSGGGNNHHSLVELNDEYYMLYHSRILEDEMGISGNYRSTHVDKVEINWDGSIELIEATKTGVEQLKNVDPYQVNEAETMAWNAGIEVEQIDEPSNNFNINTAVTGMDDGSFIGISGVDFGFEGPESFTAKVASQGGRSAVKITVGAPEGEAIGYLEIPDTGGLTNYEEVTVPVDNITGEHDLFFVFAGEEFNFDAWSFISDDNNGEEEVPSLYESYSNYFPIGTAVAVASWGRSFESHQDLLEKHFNSVTAENAMKPDFLQPNEGNFNYGDSYDLVNFAEENDMLVRGHTLVWHAQTPSWFFEDEYGNPIVELDEDGQVIEGYYNITEAERQLVIERMENHIETVLEEYGDSVYAWDVVNEAVTDDVNYIHRQNSPWYRIIGEDFVKLAFEKANEVSPDTKLFYNDYNAVMVYKRYRIIEMLEDLIEDDVPIDGIGIQAHWGVDGPGIDEIEEAIQMYADLGLEIEITELDVGMEDYHTEAEQAERYREIFELFIEYSDVINNVTLWGMTDDISWRDDNPLLFDGDHEPKEAFWEVIDLVD